MQIQLRQSWLYIFSLVVWYVYYIIVFKWIDIELYSDKFICNALYVFWDCWEDLYASVCDKLNLNFEELFSGGMKKNSSISSFKLAIFPFFK